LIACKKKTSFYFEYILNLWVGELRYSKSKLAHTTKKKKKKEMSKRDRATFEPAEASVDGQSTLKCARVEEEKVVVEAAGEKAPNSRVQLAPDTLRLIAEFVGIVDARAIHNTRSLVAVEEEEAAAAAAASNFIATTAPMWNVSRAWRQDVRPWLLKSRTDVWRATFAFVGEWVARRATFAFVGEWVARRVTTGITPGDFYQIAVDAREHVSAWTLDDHYDDDDTVLRVPTHAEPSFLLTAWNFQRAREHAWNQHTGAKADQLTAFRRLVQTEMDESTVMVHKYQATTATSLTLSAARGWNLVHWTHMPAGRAVFHRPGRDAGTPLEAVLQALIALQCDLANRTCKVVLRERVWSMLAAIAVVYSPRVAYEIVAWLHRMDASGVLPREVFRTASNQWRSDTNATGYRAQTLMTAHKVLLHMVVRQSGNSGAPLRFETLEKVEQLLAVTDKQRSCHDFTSALRRVAVAAAAAAAAAADTVMTTS
jgi:hypothetical protein